MNINQTAISEEFAAGHGTVGTSRAAIHSGKKIYKAVTIKADAGNDDFVYVGSANVSATAGYQLDAGEATPPIKTDNLNKVWVVGGAASQGYSFLYM